MSAPTGRRLAPTVWGALLLGATAGLCLGAVEAVWTLVTAPLAFDLLSERVKFAVDVVGLCAAAGGLVGLALGLLTVGSGAIAARVSPRSPERWQLRIAVLATAPAIAFAVARLFSGRRAQLVPAHQLVAAAIVIALCAAIWGALVLARSVRRRMLQGGVRAPVAAALVLAPALAAIAASAVDHCVLPRLYPAFHVGLEAGALGLWQLALAAGYYHLRLRVAPRVEPLLGRWAGAGLLVVLIALAGLSLRSLFRSTTLRAAVLKETQAPARLVALARPLVPGQHVPVELPPPPTTVAPREPLPDGPHFPGADVVLITVDAMRADRLSARTAPHLARLAASSAVFDGAYTQVPHTSFALASLLTGKYVYSLSALGSDPSQHETLAEVFKRDRYKTAAFFPPAVFYIDKEKFTEVEKNAYSFEYAKYEYMAAPGRTDQVIHFFESEKPERAFVWVHYFEPHEPYDLHPGALPDGHTPVTAEERYDGEVAFVDREVGRLIEWVRKTRPGAIVAFTADHGEEFGEHGGRYHGTTLYEEQVHVPLFINAPGLAPRHVHAPVALVDVAPTLLGLADIVPSARMRGRDLGPWLATPDAAPESRLGPVFAEIGAKKLVAVGGERLICDVALDTCELYDLASDPGEQRNLAGRDPARLEVARRRLDEWLASQSAFERDHQAPGPELARRALERGRLGDRSATREIAALLDDADPALRDEARAVLLRLPSDPETRAAVDRARASALRDGKPDARLDVAAYRLGARELADRVVDAATHGTGELRTLAALALAEAHDDRASPLALAALGDVSDEDLEKRLLAAIGALGDHRATLPLIAHLDHIRTRVDTIRAIGALGDRRAAAPLARAILDEPYVPARAELARVLGQLGDPVAVPSLVKLWSRETESLAQAALATALVDLDAGARVGAVSLHGKRGWSCDPSGCSAVDGASPPSLKRGPRWWWIASKAEKTRAVATAPDALPSEKLHWVAVLPSVR